MTAATPLARILLVEAQFVLRRTIVAVAHDLGVAELQEATSIEAGVAALAARRFDGLVLAVDDGTAACRLLARLRQGGFASSADIPVVALLPGRSASLDAQLEPFKPVAMLAKPFKVAQLLQLLQPMAVAPA